MRRGIGIGGRRRGHLDQALRCGRSAVATTSSTRLDARCGERAGAARAPATGQALARPERRGRRADSGDDPVRVVRSRSHPDRRGRGGADVRRARAGRASSDRDPHRTGKRWSRAGRCRAGLAGAASQRSVSVCAPRSPGSRRPRRRGRYARALQHVEALQESPSRLQMPTCVDGRPTTGRRRRHRRSTTWPDMESLVRKPARLRSSAAATCGCAHADRVVNESHRRSRASMLSSCDVVVLGWTEATSDVSLSR